MEKVLLARKNWSNAAALIEFNPETNEVRVYGKFYDDRGRGCPGPDTEALATVPENLVEEVQKLPASRKFWRPISSVQVSEDFLVFCDEIWEKAQVEDSWFRYELKRDYFI